MVLKCEEKKHLISTGSYLVQVNGCSVMKNWNFQIDRKWRHTLHHADQVARGQLLLELGQRSQGKLIDSSGQNENQAEVRIAVRQFDL